MPLYTVLQRRAISQAAKSTVALELTNLHADVTGAAREAVKVVFIDINEGSFFSAGEPADDYVRIVAQIRVGRTTEQKSCLLRGMFEIVFRVLEAKAHATEIQTQVVEIDDRVTVMTNGVLNA